MSKRKQRRKRRRKIELILLAAVLVFLLLPNKKSEVFSKEKEEISLEELYSGTNTAGRRRPNFRKKKIQKRKSIRLRLRKL